MSHVDLQATVTETIGLLTTCGMLDRAEWLTDRLDVLKFEDSRENRDLALVELRSVVGGMGGIIDLWPDAPLGSDLTSMQIHAKFIELGERIYELTAPTGL